jgi:hypothetical protein
MLKVFQRFDKHCICHLQGECFGTNQQTNQPAEEQTIGRGLHEAQDLVNFFGQPTNQKAN